MGKAREKHAGSWRLKVPQAAVSERFSISCRQQRSAMIIAIVGDVSTNAAATCVYGPSQVLFRPGQIPTAYMLEVTECPGALQSFATRITIMTDGSPA